MNSISFQGKFVISPHILSKSDFKTNNLYKKQKSLEKNFEKYTQNEDLLTLEAYALDLQKKEMQFRLKIKDRILSSGFFDFWQNPEKQNCQNLLVIFENLKRKHSYNIKLKSIQDWYSEEAAKLPRNDASPRLGELNLKFSKRLAELSKEYEGLI